MENYLNKVLDNRYEIDEVIGTGGMAVVYRARDRKLNRLVAVKVLKDELRTDEDLRPGFTPKAKPWHVLTTTILSRSSTLVPPRKTSISLWRSWTA